MVQFDNILSGKLAFLVIMLFCLLCSSQTFQIGESNQIVLEDENSFQCNATILVTEKKLNQALLVNQTQKKQAWFVFIDIQPLSEVTWTSIMVDVYVQSLKDRQKVHHKKSCQKQGVQLETCYISSQDFNYRQQQILVKISSDQKLKVLLKTQIALMKKLQLNTCFKIDSGVKKSQSKLFRINLKQILVNFQQIRIALTPISKLYEGQSLHMYGTFGKYMPTPSHQDFESFYAWQLGVVIKLLRSQMLQANYIFILVDVPQNYLFDLDVTMIQSYENSVQIGTGEFYNDIIGGRSSVRVFTVKVKNPQLNNYVRLKKYTGTVIVEKVQVIELQKDVLNSPDSNYLTQFKHEGYLSQNNFKISKGVKRLKLFLSCANLWRGAIYSIQTYQNSQSFNWIDEGATHIGQLVQDQRAYFSARIIRHKSTDLDKSEAQIKIFNKRGATFERFFICLIDQVQKCLESVKKVSQQTTQKKTIDQFIIQLPSIQKSLDQVAEVKQISLQLTGEQFINFNQQYMQQIVIIQINGEKNFSENIFSVQFMNVGVMDTLAQHESKSDKIEQGQFKVYRFTVPNDTSIQALVFHISHYYGYIQRFVTDQNPSGMSQQQLTQLMIAQSLHFIRQFQNSIQVQKVQIQKTYYLIVFARMKSYYGVKIQLLKEMLHPTDERNMTYTTVLLSTLQAFQITFQPGQLVLFDLGQIGKHTVLMKGSSTLPLDVCMNPQGSQVPIQPECQERHKLGKSYQVYLNLRKSSNKFSLYNGNSRATHLSLSIQNYMRCVSRSIGEKVFFEARMFQQLDVNQVCMKFNIYKKGDLLITLKPDSPLRQHSLRIQFKIGSSQSRYLTKLQNTIQASQVEESCQGEYDQCYGSIIGTVNTDTDQDRMSVYNQKLTMEVQYTDERIQLIDGVSYTYMGLVSNSQPKLFKFGVYSIDQPVSIVLENQRGYYKVLAKILPVGQRYVYPSLKQQQAEEKMSEQQRQKASSLTLKTDNSMFYLYDLLEIPVDYLRKICTPTSVYYSRACTLLVSVYPVASDIPDAKFNIQVVQHVSVLKQHEPRPGYVEANVMNFYEIQNSVENATIIVYANSRVAGDSSQKARTYCFEMYAKFDIGEKATKSNSQHYSQKGSSQLIIVKAKAGHYSLSVQGLQTNEKHCDYQIQYSIIAPQGKGQQDQLEPMKMLKKQTAFNIQMSMKLDQKSQYLLFYNNARQGQFKILTLFEQLGEILISVMALPTEQLQSTLMREVKSVDSIFKPAWKDSNSLQITQSDKGYCNQCLYLIKLQCLKQMKGQVIIPEENSQISIKSNMVVYDQLLKNQKSKYRVYTDSHLAFKLNVLSGQIHVKIINKKNNQTIFQKQYKAQNKQKIQVVELQNELSYQYNRYELIQMQSKENSHFVFGTIKDYDSNVGDIKQEQSQKRDTPVEQFVKNTDLLVFGVSKKIYLAQNQISCLSGVLEEDPIFIISESLRSNEISSYDINSKSMSKLQFQFWVLSTQENKRTKLKEDKFDIKNSQRSMIIKVTCEQQGRKYSLANRNFQLCFSSPQNSTLSVIQSSHINYLPPNMEMLIHQSSNMTFMAGQDNILEINQCSGHSLISLSKDFTSVHSLQSVIPQIRRSNSLIQLREKGLVYLTAESSGLMSITWKQVDYQKGKNLGYFIYEPGTLRILPSQDPNQQMYLQVLPLKRLNFNQVPKEILPIPERLVYEVYVQKEQLDLYNSMNCHQQLGMKINEQVDLARNLQENYFMKLYVNILQAQSINQIKKVFPDFRYVLVSVKAILFMKNINTGKIQQYRYFYPYQELILSNFKQVERQNSQFSFSIGSIAVACGVIILILVILFWQRSKIRRIFGLNRRKNKLISDSNFQMANQETQIDRYQQKK